MKRIVPLVLAIVAFFTTGLLWIVADRRASRHAYDTYSTANTGEEGLSLASRYLSKSRKVAMLTRPLGRVPLERNAVVFRVVEEVPHLFDPQEIEEKAPTKPLPSALLNDDEHAFVRGGGRLVIAAERALLDTATAPDLVAKRVFPLWPNVGQLALPFRRGFRDPGPRALTLFASGPYAVVTRERIGAGELFLIATPEIFQNQQLVSGDHLALLTALAGTNRPVYFDEVVHGIISDDGALALMKEWNLGPFLALCVLATALLFWRHGRRVGPPEEDFRDTRSEAVDLVQSLGALYHDVTPEQQALELYRDALTRTVAMQTGLRGDTLKTRVAELLGGTAATGKFNGQLNAINEAFRKLERGGTDANHR